MSCNKCKGTCNLIGYMVEKCEKCGNEQPLVFKPSFMKEIRDRWKKLMHSRV